MALNVNPEIVAPAIRYTGAFLGGSMQRVAWQQSDALGFFSTGILMVGGAVGAYIVDGIAAAAMEGLASSGAAVAGWALTGAFLLPKEGAASRAGAGASGGSRALAERMRAQLAAGSSPVEARVPEFETARVY